MRLLHRRARASAAFAEDADEDFWIDDLGPLADAERLVSRLFCTFDDGAMAASMNSSWNHFKIGARNPGNSTPNTPLWPNSLIGHGIGAAPAGTSAGTCAGACAGCAGR